MANAMTVQVDALGHVIEESAPAYLTVSTNEEVNALYDICMAMGIQMTALPGTDNDGKPLFNITLGEVTDSQLQDIETRLKHKAWSRNVVAVANKVTSTVTGSTNFLLNDAVAPASIAVARAAGRTAAVTGRAAITIGAGVASSVIQNGAQMCAELAADPTVRQSWQDLKSVGSLISKKLFGTSGQTSFSRTDPTQASA